MSLSILLLPVLQQPKSLNFKQNFQCNSNFLDFAKFLCSQSQQNQKSQFWAMFSKILYQNSMTWTNSIIPSPKVIKYLNFELNLYVMQLKICLYWLFWSIADMSRLENVTFSKKKLPTLIQYFAQITHFGQLRTFPDWNFHLKKKKKKKKKKSPDPRFWTEFKTKFPSLMKIKLPIPFGLLLTWSRLKISLFLKISTLPKILLKIVIMGACPDWKFHYFQRLLRRI